MLAYLDLLAQWLVQENMQNLTSRYTSKVFVDIRHGAAATTELAKTRPMYNTCRCYKCSSTIRGYDHFGSSTCVLFDDEEIARWNAQMAGGGDDGQGRALQRCALPDHKPRFDLLHVFR